MQVGGAQPEPVQWHRYVPIRLLECLETPRGVVNIGVVVPCRGQRPHIEAVLVRAEFLDRDNLSEPCASGVVTGVASLAHVDLLSLVPQLVIPWSIRRVWIVGGFERDQIILERLEVLKGNGSFR